MGVYNLPRNTKGEGRILYIFSTKGLIFTFVGALIGLIPYFIFEMVGLQFIGFVSVAIFGLIGFCIATFKVPKTNIFKFTRIAGGEKIDDAIVRYYKFKTNKNKYYIYKEEDIKEEAEHKKNKIAKDKIVGGILKDE